MIYDQWFNILNFITDPRDISNCRKTCRMFNEHLTKYTQIIKENSIEKELDEYFPTLINSINMNFFLSFSKITVLDFPVFVNSYQELSIIIMMKNLRKTTMRLSSKIDINFILQFVKDYKSGYTLSNGTFIKQQRNLDEKIFKFIRKSTIRYIKSGVYAVINTIHPRHMNFLDLSLIEELNVKTLITNCVRDQIITSLNIPTIIYPYQSDDLDFNNEPWLRCKEFICVPVTRKYISHNIAIVYDIEIDEVRPQITKYISPTLFNELDKLLYVFPNIKDVGVYINDVNNINIINSYCLEKNINVILFHSGLQIKNMLNYDLTKLLCLEETVNNLIEYY